MHDNHGNSQRLAHIAKHDSLPHRYAKPHANGEGSGSQRSAPPPQHTVPSSRVRQPSTSQRAVTSTPLRMWPGGWAVPNMKMCNDTWKEEIPSKVCGKRSSAASLALQPEPDTQTHLLKHLGTTASPTANLASTVSPSHFLNSAPGPSDPYPRPPPASKKKTTIEYCEKFVISWRLHREHARKHRTRKDTTCAQISEDCAANTHAATKRLFLPRLQTLFSQTPKTEEQTHNLDVMRLNWALETPICQCADPFVNSKVWDLRAPEGATQ